MLFRGMYPDALRTLAAYEPGAADPDGEVGKLAIEAVALTRQLQIAQARRALAQADLLCKADHASCGDVLRAHGILAVQQNQLAAARQFFVATVAFAQTHHDRWLEASASVNLGWTALKTGRFDEALDWSRRADGAAQALGAEDLEQVAEGNSGWAYFQLGDRERALQQFFAARNSAARLGDSVTELRWISTAGYVYRDTDDLARATDSYRQALALAQQIGSREDTINALEDLAQVAVDASQLDASQNYIDQVTPMELAGGNKLSANVLLTEGMIAAARRDDQRAEVLLSGVQNDAANPTTTRLGAGQQLARLYQAEGNTRAAERMYQATLGAFAGAQAALKSEESQLPFLANAASIYDDYIHLLLAERRSDEALMVADQSRARTLARSFGADSKAAATQAALNPRQIAARTGATLLFYWLGPKQSCLWAITPAKVTYVALPAQAEIAASVDRYRRAVLDDEDPLEVGNADGVNLYSKLVAPAAGLIDRRKPVMILADGALSQLNFETLLAPGASAVVPRVTRQSAGPAAALHYWIEDVTLLSAPSLAMLAAAQPAESATRNLLLLGDPVAASADFPSLPLFGAEIGKVAHHFATGSVAAFAGAQATPAAYLASNPGRFAYIHFVSHAVSSRTDPLDSAIILSANDPAPDSFKLYARDIMRVPIGARLVTISACNGSGTRVYAGEGLVGLSWAFLRAGAQSVIGTLWEVSDDSTPRLMDALYAGLEQDQAPAAALRQAKLGLLHAGGRYQSPFFWAPFQMYTRR